MGNQPGGHADPSGKSKGSKYNTVGTGGASAVAQPNRKQSTIPNRNAAQPPRNTQPPLSRPSTNTPSNRPAKPVDLLAGTSSNVASHNTLKPMQANAAPNIRPVVSTNIKIDPNTKKKAASSATSPPNSFSGAISSEIFVCDQYPQPGASNSSCHLNITGMDTIVVECLLETKCKNGKADHWLLYVPIPPLTSFQGDGSVTVRLPSPSKVAPICKKITDELGRELLQVVVPVAQHSHFQQGLKIIVSFGVSLFTRELFYDPNAQIPYQMATEQEIINATSDGGHYLLTNTDFQDYIRKNGNMLFRNPIEVQEEAIIYAQRIFYFLSLHFACVDSVSDHSILSTIKQESSDVFGLAILFCSILRCQELPARVVYGRMTSGTMKPYALAEFYVEQIGWIPVDVAAMIQHGRKLAKKDDGKLPFFGEQKPSFLALHCESDFQLDTIKFGIKPVETLLPLPFWASGQGDLSHVPSRAAWKESKRTVVQQ